LPRCGSPRATAGRHFELTHDDGSRLRRQAGHARNVAFRQAAVMAHQRKHNALIVLAHARLIGALVEQGRLRLAEAALNFLQCLLPKRPYRVFADNAAFRKRRQY
jgi:hypothetical protein